MTTDYTTYPDSQLPAFARFDSAAQDEIDRRKASGQASDGSKERTEAFLKSARKRSSDSERSNSRQRRTRR